MKRHQVEALRNLLVNDKSKADQKINAAASVLSPVAPQPPKLVEKHINYVKRDELWRQFRAKNFDELFDTAMALDDVDAAFKIIELVRSYEPS